MSASRPLFDPERIRGPAGPQPRCMFTVTQLTTLIKGVLAQHLPPTLHVVGELSNVSRPASGHIYFTLKDRTSEIRCVMWRSSGAGVRFELKDGMEVIVTGAVDVYEPRGQYQLYVRQIEPRGVGALELAFRQLREKLSREGLFDPAHKKPLPRWPRRIAVVTSPTGAAIRDILKILRRRFPCLAVFVYPVRVQGEGAAAEIASAIGILNRCAERLGGIDLMIVGRGGGSLEDLWAFNEEVVARAIYASRIPVVSAVGHEVDVTISDLVADVRAPTPSAAAEMVVPVLDDVLAMLAEHARRLRRQARHTLEVSGSRLETLARNEWFRDPLGRLGRMGQRIDELAARLGLVTKRRLDRLHRELHRCETAIAAIRPDAYVQRQRRRLLDVLHQLRWALSRASHRCEQRLTAVAERLGRASPQARIDQGRLVVRHMEERLGQGVRHNFALIRQRTDGMAARLESVGYRQVLHRGYSITRRADRRTIITSPEQIRPGEKIITETAGGELESRVLDKRQPELFH